MSVGENVMLPLREFTALSEAEIETVARFKLALVGLDGSFDLSPAALSGGMRKRAAIARAMALDPPLLFLDEPSAGLDPLSAARLDELILNLRDHLGTTVVLVSHELHSIFAVADRALVRQGDDVTTARDGEDGLEALGRAIVAGEEFDLVLSDVVMPSMDGPTMAREIRNLRPDLPVLFMSGYAEEQLRREIDIPNMYFLAKPFSVTQICTAVEDVLKAR
jgi:energy-coupling factor transporter ATP-binding protein EcfA2